MSNTAFLDLCTYVHQLFDDLGRPAPSKSELADLLDQVEAEVAVLYYWRI